MFTSNIIIQSIEIVMSFSDFVVLIASDLKFIEMSNPEVSLEAGGVSTGAGINVDLGISDLLITILFAAL